MTVFKCPSTSPLYDDGCSPLVHSGSYGGKRCYKTVNLAAAAAAALWSTIRFLFPTHDRCLFISQLKMNKLK